MKRITIILLLTIPLSGVLKARNFRLQNGDLLFQSQEEGISSAIAEVTTSAKGYPSFSHVGILCIKKGKPYVLEAKPPEVSLTPLKKFLHPGKGKKDPVSVVGRLRPGFRKLIPGALAYGLTLIGKSYDYKFRFGDDKYYCSELIYEIFRKANKGIPLFELNTMTFKDGGTGKTDKKWIDYFNKHHAEIPEGKKGINPGALSRQNKIVALIHKY